MLKSKKSLEWLEPLKLDKKEAQLFHDSVNSKPSEETLAKQVKLFEVARRLK